MKQYYLLGFLMMWVLGIQAQDKDTSRFVFHTFKTTKLINMQTTETLPKRTLDVRIGHKFGDLAGENGGFATFYGLEQAADVMIGTEYGITDNIGVGLFRVKGSGGLFQNMAGTFKYRFLRQENKGMPVSMAFMGLATFSTQKKIDNPAAIQYFDKFAHRLAYSAQVIVARKFGDRFSLQLAPGYVHRNVVLPGDANGLFNISMGARLQVTKVMGIIADANYAFSDIRTRDNNYYPAIGLGLEFETGGHVFQLNFTNATGIQETDYIPYTRSSWLDGGFRIGFMISRVFNL